MDGRDLTFDGIGQCAGSTWADGGGRQARPGAGKHQRISRTGHSSYRETRSSTVESPDASAAIGPALARVVCVQRSRSR